MRPEKWLSCDSSDRHSRDSLVTVGFWGIATCSVLSSSEAASFHGHCGCEAVHSQGNQGARERGIRTSENMAKLAILAKIQALFLNNCCLDF